MFCHAWASDNVLKTPLVDAMQGRSASEWGLRLEMHYGQGMIKWSEPLCLASDGEKC